MSKGLGQKIAIKFTEDLVGDVTGSKDAFTVTGKEYQYVNGPLIDKEYQVEKVERYPIQREWEDGFDGGIKDNLYIGENGLAIILPQEKIYPVADTFARQGSANTNYGGSDELCVLGYANSYDRTYLRFDTPSFPIEKAELFLFYFANDIPSREQRHHIKRITENWDEMTLTYNNAPDFNGMGALATGSYGTLVNISGHNTGINKWRSADITDLFKEWQNEIYPNYGLVLDHNYNSSYDGGVWARIKYRSKDYGDSDFHPYIKLDYDSSVPFDMEGTYSTTLQINGQYRIKWQAEIPDDTDIKIEKATTENEYTEVANGDVITANGNLWIKATLSTEDVNKTPTLKDLWLEEASAPQDKILITMHPQGRFNNVVGPLTVQYDQTVGSLRGRGGPVEGFIETFTPTDLEPKPNPHVAETVTVKPEIELQFLRVEYHDRFEQDTMITAMPSINVEFIDVSEINP